MMGYLNEALNFYFRREECHSPSFSRSFPSASSVSLCFSRFLSRASEQTDTSRLGSSLRGSSRHRAEFIKGVIFYENTR